MCLVAINTSLLVLKKCKGANEKTKALKRQLTGLRKTLLDALSVDHVILEEKLSMCCDEKRRERPISVI